MKNTVIAFLIALVSNLFKTTANNLWERFWNLAIEFIVEAEKSIEVGEVKKEYVLEKLMSFLDSNLKLNFITRNIVKLFVSKVVIDGLVNTLNEFINHDWIEKIEELKRELAESIYFID